MRHLVRVLGQRLVVIGARRVGVERQVELVLPAELEARARQGVIAQLRRRMPLAEVGGVGGDLVGDDAGLHVVAVGQAEVLLRRHVAEHRRAEPADHGGADAGRDVVVAGRDVGHERTQRVERGFAARLQLLVDVDLDLVQRHVAGAFDHHLAAARPGDLGQLAQRLQLGELRAVVGVGDGAGAQAVAERERDVVGAHDVANFFEALVEEALLVMGEAPLGHDRAAARDDAGDAVGGERHERQAHAGVDGEIVDALLALLDQRVLVDLPRQLDGVAVAFLQRLVDRHRADGHRRVADDPFARRVDVAAGGEIHHRVGAPADRPHHLLHLLLDRGGDGGVADVGVDLHQEVAADDHRLQLAVVDVGRNDGAPAGDLGAHELGRDVRGDVGAEGFAVGQRRLGAGEHGRAADVLAVGDVGHLLGDDAGARVLELRDGLAGEAAEGLRLGGEVAREMRSGNVAVVLRLHGAAFVGFDVAALATQASRRRGSPRVTSIRRRRPCRARMDRRCGTAARRPSPSARSRATARANRESLQAPNRLCVEAGSGPVVTFGSVSSELRVTLFMALNLAVCREGERRRQRSAPWRSRCRCGRCRRRRGARWSRRDRARWASSGRRGTRARIGGR